MLSGKFRRRDLTLRRWLMVFSIVVCIASSVPRFVLAPRAQAAPQTSPPSSTSETSSQTQTEQYTLSHERYEKAVAYSRAEYTLYFVSSFFGVLILLLILRLGIAAKMRDIAERLSENRILQGMAFTSLLILLIDLLDLPLRLYWHSLSLHYEQSVQGWGSWLWDWTKGELLGIGLSVILVVILFAVIRRSPRRWWLYFWFAALPILLFIFFISPWYIDPLFNKFKPLSDTHPQLVTAIARLSQRAGVPIPPERMFLMEASAKTNTLNAYVTGFAASKRVVIWDTTIRKTTTGEALFVVGHELGHYVLGHVRNGFLFFAVGLLLALYLGYRGLHWALDRWGQTWKVYGQADWAALAVLLLVLELLMFAASPVANGFSRMQEHAADVYGLEVIHGIVPNSEQVAAHAFQVMGEIDLSDPNPAPFITFWLYSHPPLAERLVFAHNYDPWSKGEPPKYVKK
jgi:STE24 endopeptidase